MTRRVLRLLALGVGTLTAAGSVAAQQPPVAAAQPPAPGPAEPYIYRLTAGDVIELKFTFEATNNEQVTIRPDGRISLAMIGEVDVEGLTPAQLSAQLAARYAKYLRHPEVVTIVREFAAQRAYVGGEVNAPAVVPLRGRMTALQAIFASGGPKHSGRMDSVLLLRYKNQDSIEVQELNLSKIMQRTAPDVALQPYDVLYVPMSRIAKVNEFVEQYVNNMIPRALLFPYNLNQTVAITQR